MFIMFKTEKGEEMSINTAQIVRVRPVQTTKLQQPLTEIMVRNGRCCDYYKVQGDYGITVHLLNSMSSPI